MPYANKCIDQADMGWNDLKTMMIYMRKAGINIRGITDCLRIHNPSREGASILELKPSR